MEEKLMLIKYVFGPIKEIYSNKKDYSFRNFKMEDSL